MLCHQKLAEIRICYRKSQKYGCYKSKYILYICTYLAPILDGKCLIIKVNIYIQLFNFGYGYDVCYICGVFCVCNLLVYSSK